MGDFMQNRLRSTSQIKSWSVRYCLALLYMPLAFAAAPSKQALIAAVNLYPGAGAADLRGWSPFHWSNNRLIRCLPVPDVEADRRSESTNPMAWYIDYENQGRDSERRRGQLGRLNALVAVGLLAKERIHDTDDRSRRSLTRS